jgi:hypothetical protein
MHPSPTLPVGNRVEVSAQITAPRREDRGNKEHKDAGQEQEQNSLGEQPESTLGARRYSGG